MLRAFTRGSSIAALAVLGVFCVASPALALTILDDFSGGSLSRWTSLSGAWAASGGAVSEPFSPSQFHALAYTAAPLSPTYAFEADAELAGADGTTTGNKGVGLAWGIQDANNYYYFLFYAGTAAQHYNGAFQLWKIIAGSPTLVVPDTAVGFDVVQGVFYTVRVDASGSNYTLSIKNGVGDTAFDFARAFSDTTLSGGKVGLVDYQDSVLRPGTAVFDNARGTGFADPVPEPGAVGLAGAAALSVLARRRRPRMARASSAVVRAGVAQAPTRR